MIDDMLFAPEDADTDAHLEPWLVLIVDDEPEIHSVTRLALADLTFQGRHLKFLSAYSGAEACAMMKGRTDIAIVLLDVVMESDDAGLQVARHIREDQGNNFTRIILRTGQPGQAPERQVILNYDINDYKAKTELTAAKLFTTIVSALRTYRDIMALEKSRRGLETIITATADLSSALNLELFIKGLLHQLSAVINGHDESLQLLRIVAGNAERLGSDINIEDLQVLGSSAATGVDKGRSLVDVLTPEQHKDALAAINSGEIIYAHEHVVAWCPGRTPGGSLLLLTGLKGPLAPAEQQLVELFTHNVQLAWDNLQNHSKLQQRYQELLAQSRQIS